MDIHIITRTHSSVYRGPFHLFAALILDGAPYFGSGIQLLQLEPYFSDVVNRVGGDPAATEYAFNQYHERLCSLPKFRFRRQDKVFTIKYASKACLGADFIGCHQLGPGTVITTKYGYRADTFNAVYQELIQLLDGMEKRVKPSDDFDANGFVFWVASRAAVLPRTDQELSEFDTRVISRSKTVQPDPWIALGLNWKQFHPDARKILDDPFYWDCVNEYAPHGNDEGADLLERFKRWRKKDKEGSSRKFFDDLLKGWGFTDPEDVLFQQTYDDSLIGLAFAHLKLDAGCPEWPRKEALKIIDRKLAECGDQVDMPFARSLLMMRSKLSD